MTSTRLRFLMRGSKQTVAQHKQTEYVYVRKDSIRRIITEAYNMGREDNKNG
jgi:hypothetical protein